MADYSNHPNSGQNLTESEQAELKREFGWSPVGQGDLGAAIWAGPLDALGFNDDAGTAMGAVKSLDIPGCAPEVDYNPSLSPHNDCRDAFRHAYWNALMAQRDAGSAHDQGDAHERSSPNEYAEHYMDLYNNRVGRKIGEAHSSATQKEISDLIAEELARGGLITDIKAVQPAPGGASEAQP